MPSSQVEQINALLPQTQCGECGFAGCRPYADAIANGQAPLNQCPPGGQATLHAIETLMGAPASEFKHPIQPKQIAIIDEPNCIGCTLCIKACPVDAIIGTTKKMHTILPDACTGCELCIAPCPMDCIDLIPDPIQKHTWQINDPIAKQRAGRFEARYQAKQHRLQTTPKQLRHTLKNNEQLAPLPSKTDIQKNIPLSLKRVNTKRGKHEHADTPNPL